MIVPGIILGVVLWLLWLAKDCFFRVEEGQLAVLTRFGGARKHNGELVTYGPGLHGKWPFEKALIVSLREQLFALSGEGGAEPVMLNDGTVIRVDGMLRYVPEAHQLERFLFGMHHPQEHLAGLFSCLMRNEVANVKVDRSAAALSVPDEEVGGAYALLRKSRRLVNERISAFCQANLGERYGVRFTAVDLTDIHPPDELADALNAVMRARALVDELRFRAESGCAQRVLAAEAGVSIAELRASAVEVEMVTLGKHLESLAADGVLKTYVQRRRDEVLADVRTVYMKSKEAR
jgi:regulator of protease activity HflC (stomatin/prohibitin superfamily)